jgi:hypothetical protein
MADAPSNSTTETTRSGRHLVIWSSRYLVRLEKSTNN